MPNIIMADKPSGDYWGALKALMLGKEDVSVPAFDGITSVPNSMFTYRTNLKAFDFSNITSIYTSAFAHTGLTNVTIPNAVTNGDGGEFDGCTSLESITCIGGFAFGSYAFRGCNSLQVIDIKVGGRSNSKISTTTLQNTQALKTIIIRNDRVVQNSGAFHASCGMLDGGKIYVPSALKASYIANSTWSQYSSMFESIEGSTYETHYANGDLIPT